MDESCVIPAYAMVDNIVVENCTWSQGSVEVYCAWANAFENFHSSILAGAYWLAQTTLVPIGILGNIALYATLRWSNMSGTTFKFLRVIALFLIGQALGSVGSTSDGYLFRSMYESGKMSLWWCNFLGRRIFPTFMRLCKLNVCVLSAALTFDRFVAIAAPSVYNNWKEKRIYRGSMLASVLIGCLELLCLAELSTVQNGMDIELNSLGKQRFYSDNVVKFIVAIKVLVILSLIIFSCVIARQLVKRGKQVAKLASGDKGLQEYQNMLYLARFQLIDMGVMIFDVGLASFVVHIGNAIKRSYPSTYSCSFSYMYYTYRPLATADVVLAALGDCVLAYAHGGLFLIYLVCFKKFRNAFKDLKPLRRFFKREAGMDRTTVTKVTQMTSAPPPVA